LVACGLRPAARKLLVLRPFIAWFCTLTPGTRNSGRTWPQPCSGYLCSGWSAMVESPTRNSVGGSTPCCCAAQAARAQVTKRNIQRFIIYLPPDASPASHYGSASSTEPSATQKPYLHPHASRSRAHSSDRHAILTADCASALH